MAKTIGIIAIKGGVGKTTIAASLASDLVNHYGKKVLIVDANFSAPNLSSHMKIDEPVRTIHDVLAGRTQILRAIHNRYGVDVIPGDYFFNRGVNMLKLKSRLESIKDNYDFIILDSSPNLNDEMLSTIISSDNLFVVTTPDEPTLKCSLRAAKIAKERGRPISGIIINKIREPKYELDLKEIEESLGLLVVAKIPDDKTNIAALFTGIPTSIYNKNSSFSREINRLSAALVGEPEKKSFIKKLFPFVLGKEEVNRQLLKDSFYESVFEETK